MVPHMGDPRQGALRLRMASESVENVREGLSESGVYVSLSENHGHGLARRLKRRERR